MNNLTIHVVLDQSSSMGSCKAQTIKAFNDYANQICVDDPTARLSLTVFGGSALNTIIDDKLITAVVHLTDSTYQPSGGTPLYDAIGHAVGLLDNATGKNKVMVILTDGEENCSTKFNKSQIKALLSERQEEENWLVIYLGANQDAFEEGAKFGSQIGTTMTYGTTNMAQTMGSAAASTMRYAASGSRAKASFTTEEREKAK